MAINGGPNLNSVAAPQKMTLATNYLDLAGTTGEGWAQQYLPDLMEKEAEVFGNRTIGGFLSQVGAEESMSADQVVWSEQGRLHLSYTGLINNTNGAFTIQKDIDGTDITASAAAEHGVRRHDMVIVASAEGAVKCLVTDIGDTSNAHIVTVKPYENDNIEDLTGFSGGTALAATILVIGSEFGKGTTGQGSLTEGPKQVEPVFKSFSNKPLIMKDYFEVSGSDASQVGWVEITGEDGQNGYMWYLKGEGDVRTRFADYVEMVCIEAVKGVPGSSAVDTFIRAAGDNFGTEGLFEAVEKRGNVTTGVTGVNAATDLAEFDAILAEFDNQGAIEENMMFLNRATSLAFDDMLATMNSYGAGGTSYGVFNNSEDMALNLGFSGFRRGSYDFYKSDWKYLNDKSTRGSINSRNAVDPVRGIIIPAGTSSVYDQLLGKNLKRPFLHVRFRASQTESRKMKSWVTGSVGATTSDLDAMQVNYLSERCLIVQGANNFMMMK